MNQPQPWEINTETVSAVCDAWALDINRTQRYSRTSALVFVSLAAPATTIKGIRGLLRRSNPGVASLIPLYAPDDDLPPPRARRGVQLNLLRNGRQLQRSLSNLYHQHHYICMAGDQSPDDEDDEVSETDIFYLFARDEDQGPAAFYRQFIRRSPTPTLPEWSEFIWDAAEDLNLVHALDCHGIAAWRCAVKYPMLESRIVEALRSGQLPLP